jgi:hypothetical protein
MGFKKSLKEGSIIKVKKSPWLEAFARTELFDLTDEEKDSTGIVVEILNKKNKNISIVKVLWHSDDGLKEKMFWRANFDLMFEVITMTK